MEVRRIEYTTTFVKKWKKLTAQEKRKYQQKEKIFRNNCYDPKLKTHKLAGRLKGLMSFSIDYRRRVLFKFKSEGVVLFYDVGTHEVYR